MSDTHSLQSLHTLESGSYHETQHRPIAIESHRDDNDNELTPEKTETSVTSSLNNKALQRPRKERRGLLANFSLIPEFKDAREYPDYMKNAIVFIIAFASLIGPMGTSIVFPAIENMRKDLHTDTMMINISVGIYLMSLGVFPLWWSAFSEKFGRRSIYIVSFSMYMGFCIGCSLSTNIKMLIGFRVLTGGCSASVQAVGAGTISDLYSPDRRGRALGVFYLGALVSPLVSPIVGALLLIRWNWRSTQWFMVILAGVIVVCIILLLPETLRVQDNKAFIAKILAERRRKRVKNDVESNDNLESSNDTEDEEQVVEDEGEEKGEGKGEGHKQEREGEGEGEVHEQEEEIEEQEEEEMNEVERLASRLSNRTNSVFDFTEEEGPHDDAVILEMLHPGHETDIRRVSQVRENDLKKFRTQIEEEIDKPSTRAQIWNSRLYEFLIRPLKAVYFLRYPPVLLAIIFSSVSFGILYFVNMTIEYEYARAPYNWRSLYVGFAYIPNSVTYIFASIYGGKWTDHLYRQYKQKHGIGAPESRISYNIFSAVITFPIALLIIGWCFNFHTHWVTPLIGTALFGYASMMTIGPVTTYIVDSLPGRGSTGVALNNLIRQSFSTGAVFAAEPLIKAMKPGPLYSMLAGILVLSAIVLLAIRRWGTYWRENYDLQKLYDSID